MAITRLYSLIGKYIKKEASQKEKKKVNKWYRSFEVNQGLIEQLKGTEVTQTIKKQFFLLVKAVRRLEML